MSFCKRFISCFLLSIFIFQISFSWAFALLEPQDPTTEATIIVAADGVGDLGSTTGASAGADSSDNNGIVRNFDLITYSVEVSLNDADDTNVNATVILNNKARWTSLPWECRTQENGFLVTPSSSITDTTGDGLNDTLFCNLWSHTEGTKLNFQPVAQAVGNNTDIISVSVLSDSDNNINSGTTQWTVSDDTTITAGFWLSVDKSVVSLASEDETNYKPLYFPAWTAGSGAVEWKVMEWHISLDYNTGSEFVQDNGSGRQDFTIVDTWEGTHSSGDTSIEWDNANGDYDDQIEMFGNITWDPLDSCSFLSPTPGASVICSQAWPGQPITISLQDIPVNQSQLAFISLKMWIPYTQVFPGGNASLTYNIDNNIIIDSWGEGDLPIVSQTGIEYIENLSDSEDFIVNASRPWWLAIYKSFDGIGNAKSWQKAAARGEIIPTLLMISDNRPFDTTSAICDTIDTTSFEFAGSKPVWQDDVFGGVETVYSVVDGQRYPLHYFYNPILHTRTPGPTSLETARQFDGFLYGTTIEYSDVPYTTTGDDHWTATCEDELDGNTATNDWTTDYTSLPGGAASVVRVRVSWDKDVSEIAAVSDPTYTATQLLFSFDLKVKDSAPLSTRIPNTAATFDSSHPSWLWNWRFTINGWGSTSWSPFFNVEDDESSSLYSFNTGNADRVFVLPAWMSVSKQVVPIDQWPLRPWDQATFAISASTSWSNASSVTMTFTDTLPDGMEYVSDTCVSEYANAWLTCTVNNISDTVTEFVISGYQVGDPLPTFEVVWLLLPEATAQTYTNTVEISSDFSTFTDDSHCNDAVDRNGNNTATAISKCQDLFIIAHSDTASVIVVADSGISISKSDTVETVSSESLYNTTLSYRNLWWTDIGIGHLIDILPYNGDGGWSTLRHNSENTTNIYTSTQTSDSDGRIEFVSITPSSAGETFEYTTDDSNTIDHRPCHPDNWPAWDSLWSGNATLDSICSQGLIDPLTDLPTASEQATGNTNWGSLPSDVSTVTGIRATLPPISNADGQRDIVLAMNTGFSQKWDLFCNNFGLNSDIVTLDIISNDVCVEIVSATIGDTIWSDEDRDGVQDATESWISWVGVSLYIQDPTSPSGAYIPYTDELGDAVSAVTNSDGEYEFTNLPAGDFQVRIDESTLPTWSLYSYDSDNDGDNYQSNTTLTLNGSTIADDLNQDFWYFVPDPKWALDKTTTSVPTERNDILDYNFVLENTGNVDISSVSLIDEKCSSTPTLSGATDIGSDSVLSPSESWIYSCESIGVTQGEVNSWEVINTAEATGIPARGVLEKTSDTIIKPIGATPSIQLFKSIGSVTDNGDGLTGSGDTVNYIFSVENMWNVTLSGVTLTDSLTTITGGPILSLDPNQTDSTTFSASYILTQQDADRWGVENTATVSWEAPDTTIVTDISDTKTDLLGETIANPLLVATDNPLGVYPNLTSDLTEDPTTYVIPAIATWNLVKATDSLPTKAWDTLVYTFTLQNTGNITISDISLTDDKCSGNPSLVSTSDINSDTQLSPGEVWRYTCDSIAVTQAEVDTGNTDNTAIAKGSPARGTLEDAVDSVSTPIGATPKLRLYKTIENNVTEFLPPTDTTIPYIFSIRNIWNVTVSNITLNDPILGWDITSNCTFPVSASVGLLPEEEATCSSLYTITTDNIADKVVENTATTVGVDPSGAMVIDISDAGDDTIETLDASWDVDNDPTNDPTIARISFVSWGGSSPSRSTSPPSPAPVPVQQPAPEPVQQPEPELEPTPVQVLLPAPEPVQQPEPTPVPEVSYNQAPILETIRTYEAQQNISEDVEDTSNIRGQSLLKALPLELPRTWTPIENRINTVRDFRVDTSLPDASIFRLAWSRNESVSHWKQVLVPQDRDANKYIVIPSNWLVVPINEFAEDAPEFDRMINGREGNINPILRSWALEYPGTSTKWYGELGNKVVFAHSSYWKEKKGRYKTHFQKIIELDEWEEIWIYEKMENGEYELFKYRTEKSYNTPANNTSVLRPWVGKNLTLFTCTPIWGITGRWIIQAKYIEPDNNLPKKQFSTKVEVKDKIAVQKLLNRIKSVPDDTKRLATLYKVYERLQWLIRKFSSDPKSTTFLRYLEYRIAKTIMSQ